MEWINVHVRTVTAEEFLMATDVQQAQWLRLLAFCATQENLGRIKNARALPERLWARMAGLTSADVLAECSLWSWDGDDLVLEFYPHGQQEKLNNLRTAVGRANRLRSRKTPPAGEVANNGSKLGSIHGPSLDQERGQVWPNNEPSKVSDSKVKECKEKEVSVSAPTEASRGNGDEEVTPDGQCEKRPASDEGERTDYAEWPSWEEWRAAASMEGLPDPLAMQEWNNQERKAPNLRWNGISRHRLRHHAAFVLGMARQRGGVPTSKKKSPAPAGGLNAVAVLLQQQQEVDGLHSESDGNDQAQRRRE